MKREPKPQPDYAKVVNQILAAGVTQADLGAALGTAMTDRMLLYYRNGFTPRADRAAALERLWLKATGKKRIPLKAKAKAAV